MNDYLNDLLKDPLFTEQVPWKIEHFEPHQTIIREGDQNQHLYLILDGSVHVSTEILLDKGTKRETGIAKLSENEIFGELSMFDGLPHSANVVAASQSRIAVIDSLVLNKFLKEHPKHGYLVMRYIVDLLVKRMRQNNIRSSSILGWYLRESRTAEVTMTSED